MTTINTRLHRIESDLRIGRRPVVQNVKGYIGISPGEWDGLPDDWQIDRGSGYAAYRTQAIYDRETEHERRS